MAPLTATEVQKLYALGVNQQKDKNYIAALETYGKIVKTNPGVPEVHFQMGRILCQTDSASNALPHLRMVSEAKPNEKLVWLARAEAVALSANDEAEADFLRALKLAPIETEAKIKLQDRFGARRHKSRPATGGMKAKDIQRMLALLESGKVSETEFMAAKFTRTHPRSAIAFSILGTAQMIQRKIVAAEASYMAAIRIDPEYAETFDYLGRLFAETGRDDAAAECFRKAITLAPGMMSALLALASMQTKLGRPAAAIPLLIRAIKTDDNAPEAYRALGNAYSRLRDYKNAETAFEDAMKRSNVETAEHLALLAQVQSRLGKDDLALKNYDRALEIDANSAAAVGGKAQLLQTLGNFEAAQGLFRRSFELDPSNGENHRMFIASHKTRTGDPLIESMINRFNDPTLSDDSKMNFGFAIAKALEDVKEFGQVFRYLDQANALMRKAYPYDIAKRINDVNLLQQAFSDVDWQNIEIKGTTNFAPIFVTGMPRSGTTLIEQIIASHSEVTGAGEIGEAAGSAHKLIMSNGKPRTFAEIPESEIIGLGHHFEAYIHERFPNVARITDKSIQSYMSLGLLKLAMPNARFVIVRRDPRDNLLSIYKNKFPDETHLYAYDLADLVHYYRTFVDTINFWRELVPDWFYEVQYEELVANPEEESRKLIAACGLEWEDACLNFHENKRKIETLSVFQARQPISKGSVKAWQRYEKELKPMLDALRESGHVTD
ncbi:MAG: sulfotransferase [Paracoccaceae bacterium]|nr:sulfotransferase [Paracoccaceae bacterium]